MYEMGIEALERVAGFRPVGYRSPGWDLTEHSIGLLRDLGFRYAPSLAADHYYYCPSARAGNVPRPDTGCRRSHPRQNPV